MIERDYTKPFVLVHPGLDIESADGEVGRVWIDDDVILRDALDEDGIDPELTLALLKHIALTGDREAPVWLRKWAEDKGCLDLARDLTTEAGPPMSEAEFILMTNPSMANGEERWIG